MAPESSAVEAVNPTKARMKECRTVMASPAVERCRLVKPRRFHAYVLACCVPET
jgi:hypothetical protein